MIIIINIHSIFKHHWINIQSFSFRREIMPLRTLANLLRRQVFVIEIPHFIWVHSWSFELLLRCLLWWWHSLLMLFLYIHHGWRHTIVVSTTVIVLGLGCIVINLFSWIVPLRRLLILLWLISIFFILLLSKLSHKLIILKNSWIVLIIASGFSLATVFSCAC